MPLPRAPSAVRPVRRRVHLVFDNLETFRFTAGLRQQSSCTCITARLELLSFGAALRVACDLRVARGALNRHVDRRVRRGPRCCRSVVDPESYGCGRRSATIRARAPWRALLHEAAAAFVRLVIASITFFASLREMPTAREADGSTARQWRSYNLGEAPRLLHLSFVRI